MVVENMEAAHFLKKRGCKMNSIQFLEEIKTYAEQYKIWSEPIDHFTDKYKKENNIDLKEINQLIQAIGQFSEKHRSENDLPGKIHTFLDLNYDVYLASSPELCEKIRATFKDNRHFTNYLFGYSSRAAKQLQATGEEIWLWRGLVSVSLENCSMDYRDTLICLAELFVTAENQGIDPNPSFQKVAGQSGKDKPRGGPTPVSEVLMNFHTYAILDERRRMKTSYWK
jgi:hypothetical protein